MPTKTKTTRRKKISAQEKVTELTEELRSERDKNNNFCGEIRILKAKCANFERLTHILMYQLQAVRSVLAINFVEEEIKKT